SEQPQQHGMIISSGLPPMNTHDAQGVPRTPMQTLMFHSNQPFANIPPPPGFENFPNPRSWPPTSLPMPPMFTDGAVGENGPTQFGFPPAIPGFRPPTPPMPMPWPPNTNMGTTVVTTVHTTTGTAGPVGSPPPHSGAHEDQNQSANMDQNLNNTMEVWRLRRISNPADTYEKFGAECIQQNWINPSTPSSNPTGDLYASDSAENEARWEFNSQNSQQDLSQSTGPLWSTKRSSKKFRCRSISPCGGGSSRKGSKRDTSGRKNVSATADQRSPRWMLNQQQQQQQQQQEGYMAENEPSMCFCHMLEPVCYPIFGVGQPGAMNWPGAFGCPFHFYPSPGIPTTTAATSPGPPMPPQLSPATMMPPGMPATATQGTTGAGGTKTTGSVEPDVVPMTVNRSGVPVSMNTVDKGTNTQERMKHAKNHRAVWGLVPIALRPLQHEVFTEQMENLEGLENWASIDLNATHPIQSVQMADWEDGRQKYHGRPGKGCGCDFACDCNDSSDSLLTAFLDETTKKFDVELNRLKTITKNGQQIS
ncbi:hypothetical protein FBUS_11881, partial [Fasciolopsis buskii]